MRKSLYLILGVLLACATAYGAGLYNTLVYKEQGGARLVVASGGSADVESGGEIDIESGGSLKLAGVAITSTAGELNANAAASQLTDGLNASKTARATLDCNAASACPSGAVLLGVSLPAKSILRRSWFYVSTQFVDSGAGTVALHCEDADNIFAAADITGHAVGTIVDGVQSGATMTAGIASACELTATVAVAEQTSGALQLFVEYVVSD